MMDLPYPSILEGDNENKIQIIYNYLLQLHDDLEFAIGNISADNLSESFTSHLETIQSLIAAATDTANTAQIMALSTGITVEDVINSSLFKARMKEITDAIDELRNDITQDFLNYYTKAEVDALIGNIPTIDAYTKSQTDALIADVEGKIPTIPTNVSEFNNDAGYIQSTTIGSAGGIAELDSNGKVPASQLPSYVDDVEEYASVDDFPSTGESGKIYIAASTNKTYRWTGTGYAEISPTIALGETSTTAYRGDRGKMAYEYSQVERYSKAEVDAMIPTVPTNVSAFNNDAGYIGSSALSAYRTVADSYSKSEVDAKIPTVQETYTKSEIDTKLGKKVDAVSGKGLSTNDYTTDEKTKLSGIATGANKTTIVNNLTSTASTSALSAAQGKALNEKIGKISVYVGTDGKIHFTDGAGADSALNFSKGGSYVSGRLQQYKSSVTIDCGGKPKFVMFVFSGNKMIYDEKVSTTKYRYVSASTMDEGSLVNLGTLTGSKYMNITDSGFVVYNSSSAVYYCDWSAVI